MDRELENFRNEWKREVETKAEEKRKLKKLNVNTISTVTQSNSRDNQADVDFIIEKGKQLALQEVSVVPFGQTSLNEIENILSHPPSVAESSISYTSKYAEDVHLINHFKHHSSGNSHPGSANGVILDSIDSDNNENVLKSTSLTASELALIAFERAVEKEHSGKMNDAVQLYREAFKLDERVDKIYREKYFAKVKPPPLNATLIGAQASGSAKEVAALGNKATPKSKTHKKSISVDSIEENDIINNEVAGPKSISTIIPDVESLQFIPLDQTMRCPISFLPAEILVQILDTVAKSDLSSFTKLSYTCKKFAYLAYSSEGIWKNLCLREFMDQHYYFETDEPVYNSDEDPEDESENEQNQVVGSDQSADIRSLFKSTDVSFKNSRNCVYKPTLDFEYGLLERLYSNSWRRMFCTRARIRFNGVYISTCNFVRTGLGQSWNSPIHMLTYYRYLRLYRDGTCINLLTTDEPNDVVPLFNKLTPEMTGYSASITRPDGTIIPRPKRIYHGTWCFNETFCESNDGADKKNGKASGKPKLWIETEGSVKKYKFCMDFEMSSGSKSAKFNKLSWQRFYIQNLITMEYEDLNLKNDKPFHFSRVLSYDN